MQKTASSTFNMAVAKNYPTNESVKKRPLLSEPQINTININLLLVFLILFFIADGCVCFFIENLKFDLKIYQNIYGDILIYFHKISQLKLFSHLLSSVIYPRAALVRHKRIFDYRSAKAFKMNILKTACALAMLATSSISVMAESANIIVTGTIIPPSCKPTLSGGGSLDYGDISHNKLDTYELTQLDLKTLDLSIQCDAPTRVALKVVNGRVSSAAGTEEIGGYGGKIPDELSKGNGQFVVGLGLQNGKKIGGYTISLKDIKGDGKPANLLAAPPSTNNQIWHRLDDPSLYFGRPADFSWTSSNNSPYGSPEAFAHISGKLDIQAYINKTSELEITQPVTLDGLTTLELHYL